MSNKASRDISSIIRTLLLLTITNSSGFNDVVVSHNCFLEYIIIIIVRSVNTSGEQSLVKTSHFKRFVFLMKKYNNFTKTTIQKCVVGSDNVIT